MLLNISTLFFRSHIRPLGHCVDVIVAIYLDHIYHIWILERMMTLENLPFLLALQLWENMLLISFYRKYLLKSSALSLIAIHTFWH